MIQMKAIVPKSKINAKAYKDEWNAVLDQAAGKLKKDFESTVQTWKHKPKVTVDRVRRGAGGRLVSGKGDMFRLVSIRDEVYFYISEGTKVRWALMSRSWRSKTKPRRLASGPGRGWVVVMGKRAMQARGIPPRPGIKARKFDKQIFKKRNRPFIRSVKQATARAAKRTWTR